MTAPAASPRRAAGRPWARATRAALVAVCTAAVCLAVTTAPAHADADAELDADAALEPVEVIVRLDPAVTTVAAINAAHGTTTVAVSSGLAGAYLLRIPADGDAELLAEAIGSAPGVDWAVPNSSLTAPEIDQDRMYAWRMYAWTEGTPLPAVSSYAPAAIDLVGAHARSVGSGVVVAVLDTGVQPDHPALAGVLVAGRDLVDGGTDVSERRNGVDDDADGLIDEGAGHGTHVAGVVHQVAPASRIMPVRVLDDDGTGTMWATTEGLLWAAANGARVINASLGTHSSAEPLRDAVAQVTASGTLVVGAAGNNGKDRRMYPGAADGAVAVASVGPGDVLSPFSNFGRWVTVAAPGEEIHSTFAFPAGSYAANSGTSMATPFVAGEAALVLARRPALTPAQVKSVLRSTAQPIDALNPLHSGELGAGRINAAAAVSAA